MHKPNIIRLIQDTRLPKKPFYNVDQIMRYFVGRYIIIVEKFDGSAYYVAYDRESGVLYEDLGKPSTIHYYHIGKIALAYYESGSGWDALYEGYGYPDDQFKPKLLFSGVVHNIDDLMVLVRILANQESQFLNNQENRMEGVVITNPDGGMSAKFHTKWFLDALHTGKEKKR